MPRKHRRKREDALVAIDGTRVRAAIEWKGLSVNGAAGRLNVSQQTLDSIVRGKTKRCYESLRGSLATLLDLPPAWLGGETDLLPSLTTWLPYPELGYQPPLWVDENMRIIRPPAEGDLTQRTTLPPRYQLAANEICQQVAKAWKRDIDRGHRKAQAALSRLAEGRWKRNPLERAMMLVTRLVSAFWWRRLFLGPPAFARPEGDDEFAVGAASALATTLGPWFTDKRELDYESFVATLQWASSGFGKDPSSGGI
jgi:transcriptional regulator with XRE-family HTH domain